MSNKSRIVSIPSTTTHRVSPTRGALKCRGRVCKLTEHHRYEEAEANPQIDDGCVFYKLLLRALPHSFKPDSIYVHMPLVTPPTNTYIMESLGRKTSYSFDETETVSRGSVRLTDPLAIKAAHESKTLSSRPWKDHLDYLMGKPGPGVSPYGDAADYIRRRKRLEEHLFSVNHREDYEKLLASLTEQVRNQGIAIGGPGHTRQVDLVKSFAQIGTSAGSFLHKYNPRRSGLTWCSSNPRSVRASAFATERAR